MNFWVEVLIQFGLSFISTVAFAFMINVPHRALLACGLAGGFSWLIYWVNVHFGVGRIISIVIAAFFIGVYSVIVARKLKIPAIIFNIPALVPLVPGAVAYQAVRYMVLGNLSAAAQSLIKVAIIIAAISIGFMMAQLVSELYVEINNKMLAKKS